MWSHATTATMRHLEVQPATLRTRLLHEEFDSPLAYKIDYYEEKLKRHSIRHHLPCRR